MIDTGLLSDQQLAYAVVVAKQKYDRLDRGPEKDNAWEQYLHCVAEQMYRKARKAA